MLQLNCMCTRVTSDPGAVVANINARPVVASYSFRASYWVSLLAELISVYSVTMTT